jgi:hypothetical protein
VTKLCIGRGLSHAPMHARSGEIVPGAQDEMSALSSLHYVPNSNAPFCLGTGSVPGETLLLKTARALCSFSFSNKMKKETESTE